MKPELERHYWIKEVGDNMELSAVTFHGIVGGIEYLVEKGYEINYAGLRVIGNMYVIPTVGTETTEASGDQLIIDNRSLKSQVTRLKNKLKKYES